STVTYGAQRSHRSHTLSTRFYIRGRFSPPPPTCDAGPADLQRAMRSAITHAIAFQRELHVQEEEDARKAIEAQGCEIVELSAAEHDAFVAAVAPLLNDARATFGQPLFDL